MGTHRIEFERDETDGLESNFWIYHPGPVAKKLRFRNGRASAELDEGVEYTLLWIAKGPVGATLEVRARRPGKAFEPLCGPWKIPAKPGGSNAAIRSWSDSHEFEI